VKYGRYGRPHDRVVRYDEKQQTISWGTSDMQRIQLVNVLEVLDGCQTKVFKRPSIYFNFKDSDLCFSLRTATRTLDLQAKDLKTKRDWLHGIRVLMANNGKIIRTVEERNSLQRKQNIFRRKLREN